MREAERNYGYNKSNSYLNRYTSKHPKNNKLIKKPDKKTIEKIFNQFIISSVIALLIIIIANFKEPFIVKAIDSVKWAVGSNYDFKTAVNDIIPVIGSRINEISISINGLFNNDAAIETSSQAVSIMIIPVDGKITSGFGMREDPINSGKQEEHTGIDIDGAEGTPIGCALDGVVVKVEENETMGRTVRIKHLNGLETIYGHCSEILVDENKSVKQGDYIAKIGHTGVVTAPHLHFEVLREGVPVDPLSVIGGIVEAR